MWITFINWWTGTLFSCKMASQILKQSERTLMKKKIRVLFNVFFNTAVYVSAWDIYNLELDMKWLNVFIAIFGSETFGILFQIGLFTASVTLKI